LVGRNQNRRHYGIALIQGCSAIDVAGKLKAGISLVASVGVVAYSSLDRLAKRITFIVAHVACSFKMKQSASEYAEK
jgi:hypothetical protein